VHAGFLEEKHEEKRPLGKPRCRWDEKFQNYFSRYGSGYGQVTGYCGHSDESWSP